MYAYSYVITESAEPNEYIDCNSAERQDPTTSVLHITLNHLMVRLSGMWIFEECAVTLNFHYSQHL